LAIEQLKAPLAQTLTEMRHSNLGSIGDSAKHGLTAEYFSHGHTVNPTHQLTLVPDLHRMSLAHTVQLAIGLDHLCGNPGTSIIISGGRAGLHNSGKIFIAGDSIFLATQGPNQTFGEVQARHRDQAALTGAPPKNRVVILIPGKDTLAIGIDKRRWGQVTADCKEPIGLLNCVAWMGKLGLLGI
jgi:hypothetical protein